MKTNKLPVEVFNAACKFKLVDKSIDYNSQKITDGVSSDIWYVKTEQNRDGKLKTRERKEKRDKKNEK